MSDNVSIIVNALLYILNKFEHNTTGKHKLFKILYFAEQKHLVKYGKTITGDSYIAMEYGPVPSWGFNIIKVAEGKENHDTFKEAASLIDVIGHNAVAKFTADLEWLSESEIECINESFEENKNLSFGELTDKSHDSAWDASIHYMDFKKIAEAGGATQEMLDYISSKQELYRVSF
ncbi:MAG: SocA family protein [Flavobacteriaceae bacterium]|nr:SocA family protein [Flavobacteriaceae bacterium]